MRYYVTLAGKTFEVELDGGRATVDGRDYDVELVSVPGVPIRHLRLDGRSHLVLTSPADGRGHWDLHLNGHRLPADVVDERTRAIRALTGTAKAAAAPKPVMAPMPGLVVRVEVEPGQAVRPGQGVAIIEAMKMENELKAEAAGVVSRVLVTNGQAVEKGAVLVEFEAEESARD